jgi:hypothetical protein
VVRITEILTDGKEPSKKAAAKDTTAEKPKRAAAKKPRAKAAAKADEE